MQNQIKKSHQFFKLNIKAVNIVRFNGELHFIDNESIFYLQQSGLSFYISLYF